jgi:phage repressor protein C with HTH and peptisase S24 domain
MALFSDSTVNQQFRTVYAYLESNRLIKGKSDIAKQLGTYNHVVNSILKGERNITIEQLNKLVELHGINANYMFGSSDQMLDSAKPYIDDKSNRQNIVLVRQRAMAGYATAAQDPEYHEQLPRFSMPGMEGELVAFEISGDSMQPTITNGDIVICEPVERGEPLRETNVYIVVTDTVVAKRIHQIKQNGEVAQLELISDNPVYRPYKVDVPEVQQILRVKTRLTNYGIE